MDKELLKAIQDLTIEMKILNRLLSDSMNRKPPTAEEVAQQMTDMAATIADRMGMQMPAPGEPVQKAPGKYHDTPPVEGGVKAGEGVKIGQREGD